MERSEIKKHQNLTNLGVIIGLGLIWIPQFVIKLQTPPGNEGMVLLGLRLLGVCFFVWGCRHYAMSKGRSPAWGWLGLLNIFGLIGLLLLGNRADADRN